MDSGIKVRRLSGKPCPIVGVSARKLSKANDEQKPFSVSTLLEVTSMANVACIEELKNAILDFDEDAAVTAAEKIIKEGVSPMDAIDAMGDALKVLGDKFQIMEVFLPEILLATDAFKAGLKVLEPELMKTIDAGSFQEKPKVVIGTVKGDVHAVGKDMDVGADVDSEVFITAAEEFGAQIIGLSALMSTTMPSQKEVIDFLEAKGLRNKYKVIVGGGPVTPQWAEQIGADGFSKDAVEAVELAKSLLK